jgi:hypothetical protein
MNELRERRIKHMQLSALFTRLRLITSEVYDMRHGRGGAFPFPNLADIYQMSPFREVLDRPLLNDQFDDVTIDDFSEAFTFLQALEWRD